MGFIPLDGSDRRSVIARSGRRCSILLVGGVFLSAVHPVPAQQPAVSPLRQIETEMLLRISARAAAIGGFRIDSGDFDLRLPLRGEPEEIVGATVNATNALAVGSARIEPLDTIASRSITFSRARYDLRLEDRKGNCLIVHQHVTFDSTVVRGRRTSERCEPLYMAEVVRRARRIARLPLTAGRLDDHWSAALAATATADVYLDSVVIVTSAIAIRASYPVPATALVQIDSVSAGLASGESSWSVVRKSRAIPVDTTLRQGGEWRRQIKRFMIPIDSSFNLAKSWPVFEVHLKAPVTADNPLGRAWTYAHGSKGFFPTKPTTK
jgi:hypothetical protein